MLKSINTEAILNSLTEGVITVDKEFRITFINESATRLTGFSKDEVLGKICKRVFNSECCDNNCPIARVLISGKNIFDYEGEMNCKGLPPVPIRLNASVIQDENNIAIGGVITFRDMTLIREMESIIHKESVFHGIIAATPVMKDVFALIEQISGSDAPVFITGETGTGKEMIANAVHKLSKREGRSFIKVNCSVIPENLLGSELFGHAKGAFTDAQRDRIGRFELADGGTIFLDEIGEMPGFMQPQVLRVLQDGSFERIGESKTRTVDARIIAATNIDIPSAILNGSFRKDLYYRLNIIHIHLPPLRERKDDIPLLPEHFLKQYCILYSKSIPHIDEECMDLFLHHNWEGNIRELENAIEYAVIRSKPDRGLCICSLPTGLRQGFSCNNQNINNGINNKNGASEIIELLNKHKWNKTAVAKELCMDRSTLWRKLKNMGLQ
ncbi:MAG: sigma 54-interacting transcriptional regulator [Ignavibacteriales bacterium]|nr:sigma 54-interacting transcriptional regulator [Ignavibacteriales bacterium]